MPEHGRMSTIRVQYGLRIKDLRDERGLSQRGFAALIGMSPTYLADIERGARNVSIDNMKRIADGFGVHVPKGYIYAAMAFSAVSPEPTFVKRLVEDNATTRRAPLASVPERTSGVAQTGTPCAPMVST